MASIPPYMTEPDWMTTDEVASRLGRPRRTVQRWCMDGTLLAAEAQLYQDPKRQWWIKIAIDMVS